MMKLRGFISFFRLLGQTPSVLLTFVVGFSRVYLRAASTIRGTAIGYLIRHGLRAMKFAAVGLTVLVIGYAALYVFIGRLHWPQWQAYLVETILSIELNFLGSRYITWRDRRANGFWQSWWYFHLARAFTVALNQGLFNLQTSVLGLPYLLANTADIIVGMAFNYAAGDMYVFAPGEVQDPAAHETIVAKYPRVSVITPCKDNADTIGELGQSIMDQTYTVSYPRKVEWVLVGDPDDATWQGLGPMVDTAPIEILELEVDSPGRDSNAKRAEGAREANGDILCYVDADVVLSKHWMANVVARLMRGEKFVAGPLIGLADTFWGRFIDRTASGAKTPRIARPIRLTTDNIGEFKPPVTANLAVKREVIELVGPPNPSFWKSYEDYQFAWAALRSWFNILLDPVLAATRYHREGFMPLVREYRRSGMGCGDFIAVYPDSPFSVFRLVQLMVLPPALLAAIAGFVLFPVATTVLVLAGILSMILTNLLAAKRIDGVVYPFIGAILSLQFVYGVCKRLRTDGFRPPVKPNIIRVRKIR